MLHFVLAILWNVACWLPGMNVDEAVDLIKAARPDLKRIVKVPEVSPLAYCALVFFLLL